MWMKMRLRSLFGWCQLWLAPVWVPVLPVILKVCLGFVCKIFHQSKRNTRADFIITVIIIPLKKKTFGWFGIGDFRVIYDYIRTKWFYRTHPNTDTRGRCDRPWMQPRGVARPRSLARLSHPGDNKIQSATKTAGFLSWMGAKQTDSRRSENVEVQLLAWDHKGPMLT